MRIFGQFVPIACLAASTLAGAQSSPAPDAAPGVLAAAREALGGEKKLTAVKTIVATGRTRQVRGENLIPIEFEIAIELPDKYVRKDEIPAQESDPSTVGFNGDEMLQVPAPTLQTPPARAGGPPPPTSDQMAAARRARLATVKQDFARLTLGMFAASFNGYPLTFSYVGKAEAPQGKADVLDVRGPTGGGFTARLFINADTHLPIMVTWQAPLPSPRGSPAASAGQAPARAGGPPPPSPPGPGAATAGQPPSPTGSSAASAPKPSPPESRLYFAEYRDVSGVQLPFRLRRAVGPDTVEETTFDGFKINAKIDPKKFEVRK